MPKYSNTKSPLEEGFTDFNKFFTFINNVDSGSFGKVVMALDKAHG